MSNFRDLVGPDAYDNFKGALVALFPSDEYDHVDRGPELVDTTIKALRNTDQELYNALHFNPMEHPFDVELEAEEAVGPSVVGFYLGSAYHARTRTTTPNNVDERVWDPLESTCRHASLSIL